MKGYRRMGQPVCTESKPAWIDASISNEHRARLRRNGKLGNGVNMQVLIVLFGSLLLYRILGALGVTVLDAWTASARFALATMFVFTAISHFAPMRRDLVAMVPPGLPRPDLLVSLTGLMELAGAVGLLFEATRWWAAWGVIALMFAMFPANVSAALRGIPFRGRRATPFWVRLPMQILFIVWAWFVR
jgi:uncharacterized membrane protein